jgi:hypothetical protein
MPTILRLGHYRFFFYSGDSDEPAHVHVERDYKIAKFWLKPIRLDSGGRYSRRVDLSAILKIIEKNHDKILEAWNAHFGD